MGGCGGLPWGFNYTQVSEACLASQNARRLAKLSLSYSNRWIKYFDATHEAALIALSTQKHVRDLASLHEPCMRLACALHESGAV